MKQSITFSTIDCRWPGKEPVMYVGWWHWRIRFSLADSPVETTHTWYCVLEGYLYW